MKYRDAGAFRQALEQRLKTRTGDDGARLARDRKRVVFDRLLARLLAVAPGRWLLKGGFALDLRLAGRARATKDVDRDWRATEKDLVDPALIAELEPLDADVLRDSIETTFARRDTHPIPSVLPLPPAEWGPKFRRLAEEVGAPSELATGHAEAAAVLEPVVSGEVRNGTWDPERRRWTRTPSSS